MERSLRAIKFGVILLILLAETSVSALAGGTQKVVVRPRTRSIPMQATASGQLTVSVVSLAASSSLSGATTGAAVLDLGNVSYAGSHNGDVTIERRKDSFLVTTAFGLLVKDASGQAHFATILAFVSGQNTRLINWVDGRKLNTIPIVIMPQVAIGGVSKHRLELEIPNSLTEQNARQHVALHFEVMPN